MAFFVLCGSSSSFSTRFYILALIALVLVCCCSYCSSTSTIPPVVDADQSSDDNNELNHNDDSIHDIPLQLSPFRYFPEPATQPSKDRLIQLLVQSALNQDFHHYNKQNNKRYAPQAFHAMRG